MTFSFILSPWSKSNLKLEKVLSPTIGLQSYLVSFYAELCCTSDIFADGRIELD
jgi:hypothetical protein